ncbi:MULTISPECIES: LytTR family DNA-binding domain-containing protein [unclassified Sphingobacterium]|uniref:LytR/AlgR family response regulator transcription factor n=1 Tax=unclassified Sphingobacterium TaxID=2609468 RepID=UPI0020C52A7F|nr:MULTISPECIES: LytTR family DNA-binding domain-containing protein [unclassified Sphingobacterium]
MINCLIIDDEQHCLDYLRGCIENIPDLQIKGEFTNPIEAIQHCTDDIDCVFVDINMPQISGLQLLQLLPKHIKIVICSAYTEFAIEGFNLNIIDFLAKPFKLERFLATVIKLKKELNSDVKQDNFFLKTDRGNYVNLKFENILFIESLQNYSKIYTKEGSFLSLISLKQLDNLLPKSNFVRVHKSFICSISNIEKVENNHLIFTSAGNQHNIPIGPSYKADFQKFIDQKSLN